MTCYLDEAGGPREQSTLLAGWIASNEDWERFESDWRLFLASYKVPYFHMKEFSQSTGPFKKWRGAELVRRRCIHEACEIIASRTIAWMVAFADHRLLSFITSRFNVPNCLMNPYAMAGRACVAQVEVLRSSFPKNDIRYVFEHGGPGSGDLTTALSLPKSLPIPSFAPSRAISDGKGGTLPPMVQLQAADLLAYELRKHKAEFRQRSQRPVRKSMYRLLAKESLFMVSLNQINMRALSLLD